MKAVFENAEKQKQEIDIRKITLSLNEDVDFIISIDKFGELVVQKQQYGSGQSSIIISPRVSNEISIK